MVVSIVFYIRRFFRFRQVDSAEAILQTSPQKIINEAGETVGVILAPDDFERIMDRLEDEYWERLVQERRHEPTRPIDEFWAELEAEEVKAQVTA